MPPTLLELPRAMETFVILAVVALVALLGAFTTWLVVTNLLDALNRLVRRR